MQAMEASPLREEIAKLGEMLGHIIREIAGEDAFQVIEDVRRLAWNRRRGDSHAGQQLTKLIASLSHEHLRVVIRAFSMFLDLANLAEDRERVRVLRARQRQAFPDPPRESIRDGINRLKECGLAATEMRRLLEHLHIELVFTAHPTEAKRRSVRNKLRTIRNLLNQADSDSSNFPSASTDDLIRAEVAKLWQTDVIRPWRPSVMQEVQRGLSIKPVLWSVVPRILQELRQALAIAYPDESLSPSPCVTFGSWIGGDRDGHPYVTAHVSEQTFLWLRAAALDFHVAACQNLFDSLSLSQRQMPLSDDLTTTIETACQRWSMLGEEVGEIPPNEVCRRWLGMIRWRVGRTRSVELDADSVAGAYASAADLEADIITLRDALAESTGGRFLTFEVQTWLDRVQTFGFHLARLDVRQDARRYRSVADELLQKAGRHSNPAELEEVERQRVLVDAMDHKFEVSGDEISAEASETISLFRLLHRVMAAFGPDALGGHVISMTHAPSDVLTVLWLWHATSPEGPQGFPARRDGQLPARRCLPIVPLFETIDDLRHGPEILSAILQTPVYREYLDRQGNRQTVMLGYSDSTKDGGYLSACWSLYEGQQQLHSVAAENKVELTFFHGRGGSLGRGGGPAARSILSLPTGTFHGSLRLTEQGEVLADRYDDPAIAHRHLEQVVWSSLIACGEPPEAPRDEFIAVLRRLDQASFRAYRQLVEQPHFVDFFRRATPIAEVEQLPMGSRPARRQGGNGLQDLRAIPWVFAWTQCRCLLPAWYGLGTAMEESCTEPESLKQLRSMYSQWQFFRATIDNAELALAKTDLRIGEAYAELVEDSDVLTRISAMISAEFTRSREAILAITENKALLDGTPWLQESIRVRNRYIDPLNLIQVELLRRARRESKSDAAPSEELQHLTRLTIKGLAAGMRTTG